MAGRGTRQLRGRRPLALLVFALAVLPGSARAGRDPLVGDAAEQALLKLVHSEKLIRAREQAERILRAQPDSLIARFALVRALHDEETNLPRALYHARQAERWLLERYGSPPASSLAQSWHRKLLLEQESLLGELDRREEQVRLIDRHDEIYRPRLDSRRIWALMKLHRFDEALRIAKQVSLSKSLDERISGLNGMIAIEMERMRPRACFEVGMQGVVATGYQSCILLHNTAEAAFAVYKFDEAERLAHKAIQAPFADCPNTSYTHLASLYLLRGDFQRAMEAVRSAREQGLRRRYRQQFEMENQGWLFRLLLALGKFDKAWDLGQQLQRAPDRVGMTSISRDLRQLGITLDYHLSLGAYAELVRERASARPLGARVKSWVELARLGQQAWAARRRASRLLSGPVSLVDLVRPYLTPILPWTGGGLLALAGDGVVLEAIRRARAREELRSATDPYFVSVEAEAAHRAGEWSRAAELGRRALGGLPRDEVLLRGRVAALAADAAWKTGRRGEADALFHEALYRWPTALRLLGLRLPVRVLADGASARVLEALRRSPRLEVGSGSFTVRVTTRRRVVRLCLGGRGGMQYACAEHESSEKQPEEERVAAALDAFHDKVFAPKVDLTQRDINSLDGSAVRGDADTLIEQVLGK